MKYKKKPVVIEAVLWTGKNEQYVYEFLTGTQGEYGRITDSGEHFHIDYCNGHCQPGNLIIHTLEGNMAANIGDFIIKGVNGEFYPCKPDIFEKTYDLVGQEE